MLVADGPHDGGACRDGPIEGGIRIIHGHHHPHGTAAERLGTEVLVLGRFVGDPEIGSPDGQLSDHCSASGIVDAIQLGSAERRFIEVDGFGAISNRKQWGYGRIKMLQARATFWF
jgi:hypothetical protein